MKCWNCNKKYNETLKECPHCGKPKYKPKPTIEELVDRAERKSFTLNSLSILGKTVFFFILPFFPFVYLLAFLENIRFPLGMDGDITEHLPNIAVVAVIGALISLVFSILLHFRKTTPEEDKADRIWSQFYKDQTSICTRCGSHDIALGRKGYDWNYAWWGALFKSRTARYTAGMDSRRVTAHCRRCGHFWVTDQQWLK